MNEFVSVFQTLQRGNIALRFIKTFLRVICIEEDRKIKSNPLFCCHFYNEIIVKMHAAAVDLPNEMFVSSFSNLTPLKPLIYLCFRNGEF